MNDQFDMTGKDAWFEDKETFDLQAIKTGAAEHDQFAAFFGNSLITRTMAAQHFFAVPSAQERSEVIVFNIEILWSTNSIITGTVNRSESQNAEFRRHSGNDNINYIRIKDDPGTR